MKVPDAEQSVVEERKVTDYLLSASNPRGRTKAAFFVEFGFSIADWEIFAEALRLHCRQNAVVEVEETLYGTKYIIIAPLATPDGRNPIVKSVWEVRHGAQYPRLVTAYPPN